MKVKYIGDHNKTDSIEGVGLHWEPGQTREVTSTVAAHLLAYPDTWIKEDGESDHAGDREEPISFREKHKRVDEPMPIVNFHGMDKESLQRFAQDNLSEKMDRRWSESVLRERVIKAWTAKHAGEES